MLHILQMLSILHRVSLWDKPWPPHCWMPHINGTVDKWRARQLFDSAHLSNLLNNLCEIFHSAQATAVAGLMWDMVRSCIMQAVADRRAEGTWKHWKLSVRRWPLYYVDCISSYWWSLIFQSLMQNNFFSHSLLVACFWCTSLAWK